ncbi:MAG: ABC transporter permease [Bacteroidales bacterium]|nr:ABC transporter permease [Bacteroidales bacterium]
MFRKFIILRLICESYVFAFQSIKTNKTRTILSLTGITIGIFSIISIFTVFDSMERSIHSSIDSLGDNVLFIQKWPWSMGGEYPWWKYWQRPEPKMNDLKQIQKRSQTTAASTLMLQVSRNIKYQNTTIENIQIAGVTHEYNITMPFDLQQGRYFTNIESNSGSNVVIIGSKIAENLFGQADAIERRIKIFGRKLTVIGVIKKEGEDLFGNSSDDIAIIPYNFARTVLDVKNISSTLIVKAKPNISNEQLKDELTGIMRSVHKLKPSADDDFSINETDIISKGFDDMFGFIAGIGWIIGAFSLLVGGFGIANIMFVSVKERTNQIGIQKSLGAKNYFILLQFLFEAIFLSIMGGVGGLVIVYFLSLIVSGSIEGFELVLSSGNIILGISVSAIIGLLSGIIPAYLASRLNPVEAMRSSF